MAFAVRVQGLRETLATLKASDKAAYLALLRELRKAAEDIAVDAGRRFQEAVPLAAEGQPPTAEGFKPRTRASTASVYVEQTRSKVTGARPDYGAKQMRDALIPAARAAEDRLTVRVEEAVAWALIAADSGARLI